MKWSELLSQYFSQLECPKVPEQYACMNPYKEATTMHFVNEFLTKYFDDSCQRTLLFGINPGRFGSGITGISFTDPIRLQDDLGIENQFDKRAELSSEFVYKFINAFGGPEDFYRHFFISAVYPLGFLHEGKNINYYELNNWKSFMRAEVVKELNAHMSWPINRKVALCIGRGDNFKVLSELNTAHHWFDRIEPLPHPRWVMQYRRKRVNEFVNDYVSALGRVLEGKV